MFKPDQNERTQGFTADPDYWKGEVFVYVGRNQNLKDLKDEGDARIVLSAPRNPRSVRSRAVDGPHAAPLRASAM